MAFALAVETEAADAADAEAATKDLLEAVFTGRLLTVAFSVVALFVTSGLVFDALLDVLNAAVPPVLGMLAVEDAFDIVYGADDHDDRVQLVDALFDVLSAEVPLS